MTCPNDTDHDGDCHLCHNLPNGCFLRDTLANSTAQTTLVRDVQKDGLHCYSFPQTPGRRTHQLGSTAITSDSNT